MEKLNLAVLISGRGSNLQALIDACSETDFPAQIKVVISNRPGVQGLERAQSAGIKTEIVDHEDFDSRDLFENALQETLDRYDVDLICLAGFMRLLGRDFVERWHNAIVNIHPSLLPAYKGLNTHERVLEDGCAETGCTVHYVRAEMDSGPIIAQRVVKVLPGDTVDILAARVLEEEHKTYPDAIRVIAESPEGLLLSARIRA
jgi:phosphoribosylglycinamide formyltransferase 1